MYPNKFYLHDVIRISLKLKDKDIIYTENGDTKNIYKVSDTLLSILEKRFKCELKFPNRVKTKLSFTRYEDLELE